MKEIGVDETWEQQNIKTDNISEDELDKIHAQTGNYEAIFSKKAMKYKSMGLKDIITKDADYKPYILSEYTFLSRPVIEIDGKFFIGNSKKNVEAVKTALGI
jgi:arsenate reductase